MKIYTKGGDDGSTSLLGGKRVPKYHQKIEAYGTIDELISFMGLLRDTYKNNYYNELIIEIQDKLMTISSHLAADCDGCEEELPRITDDHVSRLEHEIDKIESNLPPLRSFILPGGCIESSYCHICRTICRRAERITIKISEEYAVDALIIKYLNRLSDLLFVLSRLISRDLNAKEIPWTPGL